MFRLGVLVYGPVGWLTFSLTFPPFNFLKGPLNPLINPNPPESTSLLRGIFLGGTPDGRSKGCDHHHSEEELERIRRIGDHVHAHRGKGFFE